MSRSERPCGILPRECRPFAVRAAQSTSCNTTFHPLDCCSSETFYGSRSPVLQPLRTSVQKSSPLGTETGIRTPDAAAQAFRLRERAQRVSGAGGPLDVDRSRVRSRRRCSYYFLPGAGEAAAGAAEAAAGAPVSSMLKLQLASTRLPAALAAMITVQLLSRSFCVT